MRRGETVYKVLLADDDETVLEGMSHLVGWKDLGTELVGTATSGQTAYDQILEKTPDIVISDIKMPGMSGLELIEKVSNEELSFIILSGYEEFDFAKTAMQYGVKHYLIKPCNERKIENVLREVVQELDEKRRHERYVQKILKEFERVKPHIGEQFLKECITRKTRDARTWADFAQLLEVELKIEKCRLMVFNIEGTHDIEHVMSLNNLVKGVLNQRNKAYLNAAMGGHVVALIEEVEVEDLIAWLEEVQHLFKRYHRLNMTIGISRSASVEHVHTLYKEAKRYLNYRFHLGYGSIVTPQNAPAEKRLSDVKFNHAHLAAAIQSGDLKEVDCCLHSFFDTLKQEKVEERLVKAYALEIYSTIVQQTNKEKMDLSIKQAASFERFDTLSAIRTFLTQKARDVTEAIGEAQHSRKNKIVQQMLMYVDQHYADESLTLSKLAGEVFYMNADYLGKIFKHETGYKFSTYLMKIRIEQAKKLIQNQFKVSKVAEQVGFGNNPQYFSKVFKKWTGYTPSAYKRMCHSKTFVEA